MNGRGERIRTFDPLVPNQMRYQAALRPDLAIVMARERLFAQNPVSYLLDPDFFVDELMCLTPRASQSDTA